jgi:signal recognition particle receptor subunit beta
MMEKISDGVWVLRISRFSDCDADANNNPKIISECKKRTPKAVVVIFDSTDPKTFYGANAVINGLENVEGVSLILLADRQHLPTAWSVESLKKFFDLEGEKDLKIIPVYGQKCTVDAGELKKLIENL